VACPDHFPVQVSIDTVVEDASGSDHQGNADEGWQEKGEIRVSLGREQKTTGRGDQIAKDDSWLGDKQLVFDHFNHSHCIR